jgi:hypothetical protein
VNLRVVGAVALALLVGVGGGYAVAAGEGNGEATAAPAPQSATITPVPATPSVPVRLITPDVDYPALATDLSGDLQTVELPRPPENDLPGTTRQRSSLPVPVGWIQEDGPNKYTFTDPDAPDNTYALAVEFLDDRDVPTALRRRTNALRSAELEGNLADLTIDITDTDDGFVAHLIDISDDGDFRRVQLERFLPGPGGYIVTVRAVGRDRDEPGLTNLISLVSAQYRVVG